MGKLLTDPALYNALAQIGLAMSGGPGHWQYDLGQAAVQNTQAQILAKKQKEEEEKRKKAQKGRVGADIGSKLASAAIKAAAIAAAPATGGTSLTLLPAADAVGGTVGGYTGNKIAGGDMSFKDAAIQYGVPGAVSSAVSMGMNQLGSPSPSAPTAQSTAPTTAPPAPTGAAPTEAASTPKKASPFKSFGKEFKNQLLGSYADPTAIANDILRLAPSPDLAPSNTYGLTPEQVAGIYESNIRRHAYDQELAMKQAETAANERYRNRALAIEEKRTGLEQERVGLEGKRVSAEEGRLGLDEKRVGLEEKRLNKPDWQSVTYMHDDPELGRVQITSLINMNAENPGDTEKVMSVLKAPERQTLSPGQAIVDPYTGQEIVARPTPPQAITFTPGENVVSMDSSGNISDISAADPQFWESRRASEERAASREQRASESHILNQLDKEAEEEAALLLGPIDKLLSPDGGASYEYEKLQLTRALKKYGMAKAYQNGLLSERPPDLTDEEYMLLKKHGTIPPDDVIKKLQESPNQQTKTEEPPPGPVTNTKILTKDGLRDYRNK